MVVESIDIEATNTGNLMRIIMIINPQTLILEAKGVVQPLTNLRLNSTGATTLAIINLSATPSFIKIKIEERNQILQKKRRKRHF